MFKNYFKMAWRSLNRSKMSSILNISGLAVGLATGIMMMLWGIDEFSYNKFHANVQDIHLMMQNQTQGGEILTTGATPGPLAATLRNDVSEIKYVSRISSTSQQLIKMGDNSIYEPGIYAEPDFFNIMSFPAVSGDPVATLRETGSVVITERLAKKLSGKEDPIGKLFTHNNLHALKIGAVIRDLPSNSTHQFDIVLPFRIFEQENNWTKNWDYNALSTWVQLKPGANAKGLNANLKTLLKAKQADFKTEFFAYPFADLWLYGSFKNGKPGGGRIELIMMLVIIGIFVLLIACINFMNLATAHSERRAREVGIRKTLGSSRKGIIFQFMGESFLLTFLALLLGILLVILLLPGFNNFTNKNIDFDFSDYKIWLSLLAIGLFTALVAGSYPAFFLSSFQPVKVLKGTILNKRGGSLLRKGLVTFQFVISIFLIISTIVIYKQMAHVQSRPIGYDQENLIELPLRGDMASKFKILKNDLQQIPGVKNVSAGTDDLIRFGGSTDGIEWPGKTADQNFPITVTNIQYDWAKTAGFKITEGRDFSPEFGSDSLACLVNQSAVKKMGLKQPVAGTKLGQHTIIGVVEDFVYNDPVDSPAPIVAYLATGNLNHLFIRLQNDQQWQQTIAKIKQAVKNSNPDYPFEFHFTKEEYQKRLKGIQSVGQLLNVVGALAIFISCLGLFGLSAFLAERRKKEIGIRKVHGASASRIWYTLSRDFLKPVFIAFILSAPLAAWAMQKVLLLMDYHIELAWWMFALAGLLAIIIALITVSFQGVKAALVNPVNSLRSE